MYKKMRRDFLTMWAYPALPQRQMVRHTLTNIEFMPQKAHAWHLLVDSMMALKMLGGDASGVRVVCVHAPVWRGLLSASPVTGNLFLQPRCSMVKGLHSCLSVVRGLQNPQFGAWATRPRESYNRVRNGRCLRRKVLMESCVVRKMAVFVAPNKLWVHDCTLPTHHARIIYATTCMDGPHVL